MALMPILKEALRDFLQKLADCEKALAALPKGSLVRRPVKGHLYYYLVFRERGRVRLVYKGKVPRKEEMKLYQDAKRKRVPLRKQIAKLKKQIAFLRGIVKRKIDI